LSSNGYRAQIYLVQYGVEKIKESWKNPTFLWVGGRKVKGYFSPCAFQWPRRLKNRTWKDDRKLMDEVVRSGGIEAKVFNFRRSLEKLSHCNLLNSIIISKFT